MKRCVSITFNVDSTEYHKAVNSPKGCVHLALDMLRGLADFPDAVTVACENESRRADLRK